MEFLTFTPDYWNGPRHNRHYFCEELSKTNKVLFVSPPFYLVDLISKFGRGVLSKSGAKYVNDNLLTYVPSKLYFTNYRFPNLNEFLREKRIHKIKKLMVNHGIREPILLIWHPKFRDMIGCFNESLVVYYIYDQYSGYIGGDPSKQDPGEIELLKKADITFTLTKGLYEDKKQWARNIYHLPNAVDYELFSKTFDESTVIPDDVLDIPKPIIGYIGTINEKVDVDLLDFISDRRKDWSILLVGRENYTLTEKKNKFLNLVSKSNVFWLGHRAYDLVPNYIKGIDVCMMCYVINDWTFYGDPSKMHEYLSSGKPTVATGLPAIKEFGDVIMIPETKNGWIEFIEKGLNHDNQSLKRKRVEIAKQNSYKSRIRYAKEIIQGILTQ